MPSSIIGAFAETVAKRANDPAARFRDKNDQWKSITWTEMDARRRELASGLLGLGLEPKQRVNVLATTTVDWMVADLAIQSCGAQTVPIYQSNTAPECEYIINNCEAVFVFVDSEEQLAKLQEQKENLPNVQKVIVMNDATDGSDWTVAWSDLVAGGKAELESRAAMLEERTAGLTPEDILTIIYTSGTTGRPKGVVLTHGNMLYEVSVSNQIGLISADDLEFLFLPMAHVFAKVLQCIWFGIGHEMAIDGNVQRVVENLAEVRPTVLASVPRIFEKVYAKVVANGLETPGVKGKLFAWALGVNDRCAQLKIEGKSVPVGLQVQLNLAKRLVFSSVNKKLNERFGGRLRYFVSGGAPLPKKMAYFFESAGITILEGYGLTETSAATTVNRPHRNKIGTVGKPVPGTEVKIAEDGEILIRGAGVMREYWKRPEATAEVLIGDGWFATGDIGVIDDEGYLRITDRKKDIIVTAGGKNVAPQNIENLIKSVNPLISQVVVHGDKRKYLSALVTLDPDNLAAFGKDNGLSGDYAAMTQAPAVKQVIQGAIDTANSQLAKYETIKRFEILDRDFEVGVELTPTLKVKRKICNERYQGLFDGMYDEAIAA